MKKFIVETYYTCTFKTVHTLNDLNDKELSKIDDRNDGSVELIDVKLNNRKTKKLVKKKIVKLKILKSIPQFQKKLQRPSIKNQLIIQILNQKIIQGSKCQIEEKDIYKKRK